MGELVVRGIRCRLDADDRIEMARADLVRSKDPSLAQVALADGQSPQGIVRPSGNADGWVSEAEVWRTTGFNGRTPFDYLEVVTEAQRRAHPGKSVLELREQRAALPKPPPPVARSVAALAACGRSAFVPLAEHIAHGFARAKSYATSIGSEHYYFQIDELLRGRKVEEVAAACAILTSREGREIALTRDAAGRRFLVFGEGEAVETVSDITGLDLLFHTHPACGESMAQPSGGDLYAAATLDPDHHGAAVSEDGFWVGYEAVPGKQAVGTARRLWRM